MRFNSWLALDNVLDKNLFQVYQQFMLVYSLSLNIPQTLNRRLGVQSYICFQVREMLSIYRTTLSFHENHQPIQGWGPTTTI